MTVATQGGYYSLAYTPSVTGSVEYRVFFTGVPANDSLTGNLGGTGPNTPAAAEAYSPPQAPGNGNAALNTTGTKYSDVTTLNIGTLSDVITAALASLTATNAVAVYNAACSVADSTNTAIQNLAASTNSALSNTASKTDLQSAVDSINGNVTNVSYISYAALAVAIILGLIAISMARRKPS